MFKNLFIFSKPTDKKGLEHYLVDALLHFESGEYVEASRLFRLIVRAYPEHPLAHLMLARTHIELGEWKKAIEALFKHLKIVPNSVEALIYLGLSYYEIGKLSLAEERFEQALQIRGESVLARENLAVTRLSAGELDRALDDLVSLHEEKPNDAAITELLIVTLGRLGSWEAARQYVHSMESAPMELIME
jgi:tetratricopeptide (TPR) repeat protein